MFTDLDGPLFEANFDRANVTKIAVDSGEQSSLSVNNSSMNSLSNSLTSSLNGDRTAGDHLVSELNCLNNNLSKNVNQNLNSVGQHASQRTNASNQVNSLNRKNNLSNLMNDSKKEIYDPFSSEWVSNLAKNDHRSTNPFLQNLGTTVFELKM